jgi:hypothetical protein
LKIEYAAKVFQKYCVLCDCLETTGTIDMCRCFTCGNLVPRDRKLHGGHWKKRSNRSVVLERANCNAQCYVCNIQQHGNMNVYEQKMIEKYGQEEHDRIVILARQPKKWMDDELEPMVKFWRSEIKRMEKGIKKGLAR